MDNKTFGKYSVLYVEDEPEMRKLVGSLLTKNFGNVYTAADGHEGFSFFMEYKPDIVITDLEMPIMSGGELINKIKSEDPSTPVIVITVFEDEASKIEGYDLLFTKPLIKKQLFDGIKKLLKMS